MSRESEPTPHGARGGSIASESSVEPNQPASRAEHSSTESRTTPAAGHFEPLQAAPATHRVRQPSEIVGRCAGRRRDNYCREGRFVSSAVLVISPSSTAWAAPDSALNCFRPKPSPLVRSDPGLLVKRDPWDGSGFGGSVGDGGAQPPTAASLLGDAVRNACGRPS